MSPDSNTESYPAFARIGLRKNPGRNLNQNEIRLGTQFCFLIHFLAHHKNRSNSMFVICWSPYIVFDLLQVYGHVPRTQTNIAVASFIQSLAPLNSAANPVIYCLFSTSIGRTLRQVQ
ncbi:hypothetical protein ANN_11726 [Periplaneta americana]|uniref:G-protein coupled receptors family 1 profile domain-containing protein n=1 Tax=Periplaneta americana TaxID=6978 RepID=A0ABQ8T5V6_PERAM|nr:hypothetical protein ANN_11726 [Periplaneta americana]